MTYEQREQIFSKEVLTTQELSVLFDCDIATASTLMNNIKRGLPQLRLNIRGKIHTQDYLDYFSLDANNKRYFHKERENEN